MTSPKALWTEGARRAVVPAAEWFANGRVTPNRLTVAGLVLNVATAPLIITGHFLWALAVYLAASICDLLDGAVARVAQQVTAFGAFLDSTSDRLAEGITLGALGVYFARGGHLWEVGALFVALTGSFLVSYVRAKAEAMGLECKVGLASRPERVFVLCVGFAFARWHVLTVIVYFLAVVSAYTVVQRILYVRRQLRARAAQSVA